MAWFGFELKNLGKISKSDSFGANFQSFIRIIVKMAKLGLSLLNRLQYIPICKILPNDRLHKYSWFCLESFITVFWIYCCFAQGMFCCKANVANHALQFTHSCNIWHLFPPLITLKTKNNLKTDIVDGFCKSCDVFEPPPISQVGVQINTKIQMNTFANFRDVFEPPPLTQGRRSN